MSEPRFTAFEKILAVWLYVSIAILLGYIVESHFTVFTGLYFASWVGIIGTAMWLGREKILRGLRAWQAPAFAKFLVLSYGMVLCEETLAAFTNSVSEGFSVPLFLTRIPQFWDYNILAFTGLIIGLYIAISTVSYSIRELSYIAGLWGLYAERTYQFLPSDPFVFAVVAIVNFCAYALIMFPALLSYEPPQGRRQLSPIMKYPLALILILLSSIIPRLLLSWLRLHSPLLFPPQNVIP